MPARPVLVSCRSGSPLSQTAELVVTALELRGLAEAGDEAALDRGGMIVTLDGCPSACLSRRLAAEGRPPSARLNLADCGVDDETLPALDLEQLADKVARLLADSSAPGALARPHKPKQRAAASSRPKHTPDDYLLAIDTLTNPVASCGGLIADVPTLAAHVSALLGVSRPSAGEMLVRLEEAGLVRRGTGKELLLTAEGRRAADAAIRRQRLLEVFAVSFLGYPLAECFDRARSLGSVFDDDALERVRGALGDTTHCPHGWPIDAAEARKEGDRLASLSTLEAGETRVVVRVAENDASLPALVERGVVPGAQVTVRPAGRFEVEGHVFYLDDEAAAAVLCR